MKGRKPILVVSLISGALALLGAGLFTVAGAMIYGSFARVIYSDATLLLVLLCGPVSVLPCTLLNCWKLRWNCSLRFGDDPSCCDCTPQHDGVGIFYSRRGAWFFVLGAPDVCDRDTIILILFRHASRVDWLWWILLVLAGMAMGYFLWRVGADGVGLLIYVLRGGII